MVNKACASTIFARALRAATCFHSSRPPQPHVFPSTFGTLLKCTVVFLSGFQHVSPLVRWSRFKSSIGRAFKQSKISYVPRAHVGAIPMTTPAPPPTALAPPLSPHAPDGAGTSASPSLSSRSNFDVAFWPSRKIIHQPAKEGLFSTAGKRLTRVQSRAPRPCADPVE